MPTPTRRQRIKQIPPHISNQGGQKVESKGLRVVKGSSGDGAPLGTTQGHLL